MKSNYKTLKIANNRELAIGSPHNMRIHIRAIILISFTLQNQVSTQGVPPVPVDGDKLIYLGSHSQGAYVDDVAASGAVSHYFISSESADWFTARDYCKQNLGEDAGLVFLETQEELDTVEQIVNSQGTISSFWVGGQYNVETSSFQWINGDPFGEWIPWDDGHPDSQEPETKVYAHNDGNIKLRTELETMTLRYCCEMSTDGK